MTTNSTFLQIQFFIILMHVEAESTNMVHDEHTRHLIVDGTYA